MFQEIFAFLKVVKVVLFISPLQQIFDGGLMRSLSAYISLNFLILLMPLFSPQIVLIHLLIYFINMSTINDKIAEIEAEMART